MYRSLQDVFIATHFYTALQHSETEHKINCTYEGWNLNSGNYLFTTDTK